MASENSTGPNPREFVEKNFSSLSTSEGPRNEELSDDDLVGYFSRQLVAFISNEEVLIKLL